MPASKRTSEALWSDAKAHWHIKVQKDGVRKSFYSSLPGRRGKHEAENKADEWLESRGGSSAMRFKAAWDAYEKNAQETTGTCNYKQVEYIGRMYVRPNVPNMLIADITPAQWQKCVDAAVQKGLSRRTCKDVSAVVSGFVLFCRRQRWQIERLERGDITIPNTTHVGKRRVLKRSDMATLFTEDTYTYRLGIVRKAHYIHAWRLLVLAGLRRGELCGLRWEDWRGNALTINRAINQYGEITKGKNDNARRVVALGACARAVLADQRAMLTAMRVTSPWIFPDEKGGDIPQSSTLYHRWAVYRKQHGIAVSLHEMRHTFVSAVKSDMPAPLLKAMIGHSEDMDTYGVYGHEVDGDLEQTASIVDSVFNRLVFDDPKRGIERGMNGVETS